MVGVTREWPVREYEAIHDHLSWKPLCRVHRAEMARIETSYITPGIQITVVTGLSQFNQNGRALQSIIALANKNQGFWIHNNCPLSMLPHLCACGQAPWCQGQFTLWGTSGIKAVTDMLSRVYQTSLRSHLHTYTGSSAPNVFLHI